MKYESIEDLSIEQRLTLNKRIAEALEKRDAFTTEADVRYFETDEYLYELSYDHWVLYPEEYVNEDDDQWFKKITIRED